MKNLSIYLIVIFLFSVTTLFGQNIPLPEHPRPDFQREQWQNLNGEWDFEFDSEDEGLLKAWNSGSKDFSKKILVPFPWGSELSGLEDEADIGWYKKEINIDPNWESERTFLTIGASDWETTVWLDGKFIGKHQGGYVPFSFELTENVLYGQPQSLIIRVDDTRRDFTLYGKQGYGNARGIWQTIYLEARGENYIDALHFTPDIDNEKVGVTVYLPEKTEQDLQFTIEISGNGQDIKEKATIPSWNHKHSFDVAIENPRLWNLDDPYLYEVKATLEEDKIASYFGMRKISVVNLPGTEFPYIALNDEPVYLQLALDQSYHPEGFYTFPSDQFMREEIERSKSIGLNGIRTHIKVEVPRKLYWADKLGLLVMEDLPNSWGEPDEPMQAESEYTLRQMIKRDYNHPSIFSWVIFNETWGLISRFIKDGKEVRQYLPRTQHWVASMYYLAKSLDPTRLVEDNSICCGRGHTETDINSWHSYLPGWEWDKYLKNLTENTYEGSSFDFEKGFKQGKQPNINSECGNVWGYHGSTGDVDWSWDYHRMMNTFRKYPKVGGWLYTEHHDVINEWNGYWRFDRTEKETGMGEIVNGMTLNDLHAPVYLSTGNEICKTVIGGDKVEIPLYLSVMTGKEYGDKLHISYELSSTNYIGEEAKYLRNERTISYKPYMQKILDPLSIPMPDLPGMALLSLQVSDNDGAVLHRNFMYFEIQSEKRIPDTKVFSVAPKDFSEAEWSKKQWNVLEGKKVNGAGKGYFEYTIPITDKNKLKQAEEAYVLLELSAKEFFVKDQEEFNRNQDYMKGSRVAPSSNPNSYPMTDET
ncbi:MAG: glycoside hydrolase family 2, partial [Bacteroidetes bacterium]|nr:glycoside hydrolase family 2 [Bacteroidota bacterium]